MTIEEVWKHITILKNKTTDSSVLNVALVLLLCALIPIGVILSGSVGFNIDFFDGRALVLEGVIFIIPTLVSLVIYIRRPENIKLYVCVDNSISVKQLKKYFKVSKAAQDNNTIVCNLKPKDKYYDEVVDLINSKA